MVTATTQLGTRTARRYGRWLTTAALGVLVLALGTRITSMGLTLYADARAVQGMVPEMRQDLTERDWLQLDRVADRVKIRSASARAVLVQVRVLAAVPGLGPRYDKVSALVNGLFYSSHALTTVLPSVAAVWPTVMTLGTPRSGPSASTWTRLAAAMTKAAPDWVRASTYLRQVGPFSLLHGFPLRTWAHTEYQIGQVSRQAQTWASVLGLSGPTRYLLLFQDSGELRASGGFLSGYGYLTLHGGTARIADLRTISGLSKAARLVLPAPWTLHHFFGSTRMTLMNANLSPNVPTASKLVEALYDSVPGHPRVNGVVWLNTWMANRLLAALGSVSVSIAGHVYPLTAGRDGRRDLGVDVTMERIAYQYGQAGTAAVLTALSQALSRLMARGSMAQKMALVQILIWGSKHQDLIIDNNRPAVEREILADGWGGEMAHGRGNFLEVVDDNFGAHKDNLYLRQQVTVTRDGLRREQIVIREQLPVAANGWLVVPYRGWMTLYLPPKARVLAVSGSQPAVTQDSALDATAVGFAVSVPARRALARNTFTMSMRVELSAQTQNPNRLTVVLQPGQAGQQVTVGRHTFWQTTASRTFLLGMQAASRDPEDPGD